MGGPAERRIAIIVARPFAEVEIYLAEPRNWPAWASGLASGIERVGEDWVVEQAGGRAKLRFMSPGERGNFDHLVTLPDGRDIKVPLRAIEAEGGTEVALTLFRRPEMSAAEFARDGDWVRRDLAALKGILEGT